MNTPGEGMVAAGTEIASCAEARGGKEQDSSEKPSLHDDSSSISTKVNPATQMARARLPRVTGAPGFTLIRKVPPPMSSIAPETPGRRSSWISALVTHLGQLMPRICRAKEVAVIKVGSSWESPSPISRSTGKVASADSSVCFESEHETAKKKAEQAEQMNLHQKDL